MYEWPYNVFQATCIRTMIGFIFHESCLFINIIADIDCSPRVNPGVNVAYLIVNFNYFDCDPRVMFHILLIVLIILYIFRQPLIQEQINLPGLFYYFVF